MRSFAVSCLLVALLLAIPVSGHTGEPEAPASDLTVLPFAYYTPETKTAFVLLGIYTTPGATSRARPSSYMAFLTYSVLNQRMFHVVPDVYTSSGFRFSGSLGYMDYPDQFYGIGPDVTDASEELFTREDYSFDAAVQYEFVPGLFAGLKVDLEDYSLDDIESGGLLDSGVIPGSEGGLISGSGLLVTFDNRDDIFDPGEGLFAEVLAMSYGKGSGGDFTYDNVIVDLRQFTTLGSVKLGFQQYLHLTGGDPPFNRLAKLGGSSLMRGYFMGQYRDRNMAAVQVESRIPLPGKWGLAFFGSAGAVAPRPGDLDVGSFISAAGGGVRYRVADQEAINLRVDLAWGEDGSNGVYFTINEAF